MNVVFDHQIFSWQRYGGISRYFFELARHLTNLPHVNVTVVSPIYVNEYLRRSSEVKVSGLYLPRVPKTGRLMQLLNATAVRRNLYKKRPDIVHETYYYEKKIAPKEVPVVVTVHDMIYEKYPHYYPSWDRTRFLKEKAIQRADHVICVSENTKYDLIEILGIPNEKISVIHHGYALTTTISKKLPRVVSGEYLLYVGLRSAYKNFRLLLEAYAASNELRKRFRIVCFGGGGLTRSELNYMKKLSLPVDTVIQLAGDDSLLSVVYQHATMLVYPSLYEGFGIPPLEAMAHGCPVVCSGTSSLPEVCGDAASYFNPCDVAEVQFVIEKVVNSPVRLAELKQLGYQRIKLFSWDECARKTALAYDIAIGASRNNEQCELFNS